MKIKLKAEKKKLLELIRTRTPQNLLLSLEIGRGLGIERWVECAWVRECMSIKEYNQIYASNIKNKHYKFRVKNIANRVVFGFSTTSLRGISFVTSITTTNLDKTYHISTNPKLTRLFTPIQLRSVMMEYFVNYIKYILPHEL